MRLAVREAGRVVVRVVVRVAVSVAVRVVVRVVVREAVRVVVVRVMAGAAMARVAMRAALAKGQCRRCWMERVVARVVESRARHPFVWSAHVARVDLGDGLVGSLLLRDVQRLGLSSCHHRC